MSINGISQPSLHPPQTNVMFRQLQHDTLTLALPGLYIGGIVLIAISGRFPDPLQGGLPSLILFLLPIMIWILRPVSYLAAAWTLVMGTLLVGLLLVTWSGLSAVMGLLALPAGLAALFISMAGGVGMTITCTVLLLYTPSALLPPDGTLRIVAIIQVWSTVGLIWLTSHPLLTTTQWFWSSYEQSRRLLERARDYQVQLAQTLEDLTDANLQLTRLNRFAEAMRQLAEDARRAKEQFVANVSHELRTPLNMIIGFTEMVVQSPEAYGYVPPALLADLTIVLRNSQHLSSLIDDILDLSQIEAGQMALTKERVTFHEIVEAAAIAVRPLFDSKGLYLKTEVSKDLPSLFCDRTRIRQVMLNLLSNAGRFTEHGGVSVRAWQEGDEIVVSVADTGPGIAPEDMNKLFQPFQQLDESIRRRHGGSGLGLSISKSFVELHGGKMWVESRKGLGTIFYFGLPIDAPTPVQSSASRWFSPYWKYEQRPHRPTIPRRPVHPRFVVLETGNSLQRLLTRYLDDAEIVPVSSIEDAVRELSHTPAQALVINAISVSETLEHFSQSVTLPFDIPTIICSVPGPHEFSGALNVCEYLVKPVSRDALLAALDRLKAKGKTVLIVDDDREMLRLFRRMLTSSGQEYRVLRATDGKQAINMLREYHPDVMLLDLVMPEMDGFQLLAAKAQDPVLRDIPVIVISARDPAGQPIVSKALAITRSGGLSVPQLLAYIEAVSGISSPASQPEGPAPTESHPG